MNAIEVLKMQHRRVKGLFEELQQVEDADDRATVFQKLADDFAADNYAA